MTHARSVGRSEVRDLVHRLSLAALLAGMLLALAARPRRAATGEPLYWAADRDGGALIGLDADLFVVARRAWPWPLALEPAPEGQLWVAWAPRGHPAGGQRLSRCDPAQGELDGWDLGRLLDLAAAPDGGLVWLEERDGRPRLGRVGRGGSPRALAAPPGSACLAVGASRLLVGTAAGEAWSFDGGWDLVARLGSAVLDLAAAGDGGWWVLTGGDRRLSLVALGPDLRRRGRLMLDGRSGVLAVGPSPGAGDGPERVWVGSGDAARGWWAAGPDRSLREVPLSLQGVSAGWVTGDGGVLFALPGALVRKGADGTALPGQGGFDYLVDVVRSTRASR